MHFFDINSIFFEALGYSMSHLEFWATVTGGIAVWLSARENVWSWIIGLANVVLAFVLFYQIQLYPDMFLQVFFFITNLIGWWQWKYPKANEANRNNELKISKLSIQQWLLLGIGGVACTVLMGTFAKNLHEWLPTMFSKPSAFPYMDSFTTVMSILATFMLIRKKNRSMVHLAFSGCHFNLHVLTQGCQAVRFALFHFLLYCCFWGLQLDQRVSRIFTIAALFRK